MKLLGTLFFSMFLTLSVFGQKEGKIDYTETVKLDIQIDGMDEAMKAMLPKSQTVQKQLTFDNTVSIYAVKKGGEAEDLDLSSDDGSFRIKIRTDDAEEVLYKDLKTKTKIHQRGIMGKSFLVEDELEKHKWKLTGEKIMYLGYECQKAVIENEDDFVVAWFTSQLPVQIGPAEYHGLPGAILMISINDGESEIKATKINLDPLAKDEIVIPNEGTKVNEVEYAKIQAEKDKEMEERYGKGNIRRTKH